MAIKRWFASNGITRTETFGKYDKLIITRSCPAIISGPGNIVENIASVKR